LNYDEADPNYYQRRGCVAFCHGNMGAIFDPDHWLGAAEQREGYDAGADKPSKGRTVAPSLAVGRQ